ncbi:MAG: hypothetical protein AAGK14_07105, partial [Verrucomicrobiota bacterium]
GESARVAVMAETSPAENLKNQQPDLWMLVRPAADTDQLQPGDFIFNQEPDEQLSLLAWLSKDKAGRFWEANQDTVGEFRVALVTFAQFQKFLATLEPAQREAISLRMG